MTILDFAGQIEYSTTHHLFLSTEVCMLKFVFMVLN